MNSVIGRVFTGICGGLVMAAVNHWNSLDGWAYGGSIAAGFVVFFAAAILFERRVAKKSSAPTKGVGSHNETQGKQRIEIAAAAIPANPGPVGTGNKATGNQTIKIN